MKAHLAYLKYVIRHKWFVLLACRKWGVSIWRGLIHDISKFSSSEWTPYVRSFYNPDGSKRRVRDASGAYDPNSISMQFSYAWNHHEKHNPHHWGYWVVTSGDYGKIEVLPMPETYVREMIADWEGAGKTISGKGDPLAWYQQNGKRFLMHDQTRTLVEKILEINQ
jgi:hypothetical protein